MSDIRDDHRDGVSFVICCHNSASRLPQTLRCLAEQKVPPGLRWEVIVVDNGSTDDTVGVARASWPDPPPAPLLVVREPVLGLSHARIRGLDSSSYEIVTCVDDDNRLAPSWLGQVYARMMSDPAIGVCGGKITADFEGDPPKWWGGFIGNFAVGRQWPHEGDVTGTKGWVYGAGLTLRKSAWTSVRARGFKFYTTDRRGKALMGGGDNEVCYALRLAGWKIWLDWSLEMRHFIPKGRMQWDYVRRMFRGAGATSLVLGCYHTTLPTNLVERLRMEWWWQALSTVKQVLLHPSDYWAYAVTKQEGDYAVLRTESRFGRLRELLRIRSGYRNMIVEIRDAEWRNSPPPGKA